MELFMFECIDLAVLLRLEEVIMDLQSLKQLIMIEIENENLKKNDLIVERDELIDPIPISKENEYAL